MCYLGCFLLAACFVCSSERSQSRAPGSQEDIWARKPPGKPPKTLRKIALPPPPRPLRKNHPLPLPPPNNQWQRPPTIRRASRMQLQPRSPRPQPPERPPQNKIPRSKKSSSTCWTRFNRRAPPRRSSRRCSRSFPIFSQTAKCQCKRGLGRCR
jgi:hypothetical protein